MFDKLPLADGLFKIVATLKLADGGRRATLPDLSLVLSCLVLLWLEQTSAFYKSSYKP